MKQRVLSLLLTGAMLLSMCPPGLALEPDSGGLCPHHTEHTESCGYREAVEGQPCGHIHDGDCGFVEAQEEIPCDMDCAETGEDGQIIHAEGCAYTPAVEGAPCQHEHDGECGYVPADPGQPCGFVCRICPVQAIIDALPAPEDITPDNRAGVEAQLEAIGAAYGELSDEEILQLDTARCEAAQDALAALDEQTGNNLPTPLAEDTGNFTVSGGALGTDYTYAGGVLTIEKETELAISGPGPDTSIQDKIVIKDGIVANVTLENVNIDVSGTNDACAFEVAGSATCNLTLMGENILKSGSGKAGLQVEESAALTVTGNGDGSLEVTGSNYCAGIGGGYMGAGGNVTIHSGQVTATGNIGAGIGGGYKGAGGTITISGGTVNVANGNGYAGIGAGGYGTGGDIIINGGKISTTESSIEGESVTINDGTVAVGGNIGGNFSTGDNGSAVIMAFSISDNSDDNKKNWSGVIFEGNAGRVYGNQTLQDNFEIESGKALTIPNGSTLTVESGKTLTNNGTIGCYGEITGNLVNNGTIMVGSNGIIPGNTSETIIRFPTDEKYLDKDGGQLNIPTDAEFVFPGMTVLNSGWYIVYQDITLDRRVTVNGNVSLILMDGKTLNVNGGINVSEGNELTIYGQTNHTGTLIATAKSTNYGAPGDAGIGGNAEGSTGTITINGGTVNATGGGNSSSFGGAGIGGGGDNSGTCGTITINGGNVTANGSYRSAGIGGGCYSNGGTITINGGTVAASGGGWGAAGIGNGKNGDGSTFSTGTDGNAFIVAKPKISDNGDDRKQNWSGVIFEGDEDGKVYGTPTLKTDATIPSDKKLEIPADKSLTIDNGVTLTNEGTITNDGTLTINKDDKLVNNGAIINNSSNQGITGEGTIEGTGTLSGSGNIAGTIKNNLPIAPTITTQPGNRTVSALQSAKFTVVATGNPAPSYQWQVSTNGGSNWTDIGGATSNSYTIDPTSGSMNGWQYRCVVKNDKGEVYSEAATLTVNKLTPTVNPPTTKSLTFNNTAQELINAGSTKGGELQYSLSEKDGYSTTIPKGTNAGDYTVYYKVVEDDDYSGTTAQSITATIDRATPTPDTPTGLTATYGEKLENVTLPTGWAWGAPNTSVGDVGNNNSFPAIYTHDSSGNYEEVKQSLTVTVQPAPRTITVKGKADSPTQVTLEDAVIDPSVAGDTVSYGKSDSSTGSITWQADKVFSNLKADTTYYFFAKVEANGNYAAAVSNEGVVIATPAKAVSSIKIADQPTTLTYTSGETLDLSGLSVTVEYDDGTNGTIIWSDNKLAADPAAGTVLTVTGHNGKTVTISYGGHSATTNALTVTQGTPPALSITGAPTTIYNGDSFTLGTSGGSSTGAITWEIVSGPAAVDGSGKVTVTGTGEIQIKAVKAADTDYTQAEATITLNAVTRPTPPTGGGGGGYTPPTTYPPTVEKPSEGGGAAVVSPSNPKPGDKVTVTPKPDGGYEVDKITTTGPNGKPVEVTRNPDGTYTFKQPTGKVKIEVTYKPVETPWNNPFSDVSEGDWYYEAVRFVHERGLMNGYSDGRFGPNDTLSRAQLAQILFNKEGRPGVDYLLDFSDVANEAWYTEAIRWATSQGIVGGYGNGTFGPNDPITREQLAVMLWRYSGSPAATNKELHFNDTDEISGFALEAIRWAVENGILNGYGDGRLGPQGQATRAQMAQMLKNFIENQEENT